jgi:hypothetical protein
MVSALRLLVLCTRRHRGSRRGNFDRRHLCRVLGRPRLGHAAWIAIERQPGIVAQRVGFADHLNGLAEVIAEGATAPGGGANPE